MQSRQINYTEFKVENLIISNISQKNSKPAIDPKNPAAGPVSHVYYEIEIKYKYEFIEDGVKKESIDVLQVEGSECYTNQGIVIKTDNEGRTQASILAYFDLTKPETKNFVTNEKVNGVNVGFWSLFYEAITDFLFKNRGSIPVLSKLSTKASLEGAFSYPIFYPRDKSTSDIIEGRNPSKFIDLVNIGKEGSPTRRETLFTIPAQPGTVDSLGNPVYSQTVPWNILKADQGVKFSFIPLFKFDKIIITSKVSFKTLALSAVITDIAKSNSSNNQTATLKNLQQNTKLVQSVQHQVSDLLAGLKLSVPDIPKIVVTNNNQQPSTEQSQQGIPQLPQFTNPQVPQQFTNSQQGISQPEQQFTNSQQQQFTNPQQQFTNPQQDQQPTYDTSVPSIIPKPVNNLASQLAAGPIMTKIPGIPTLPSTNNIVLPNLNNNIKA